MILITSRQIILQQLLYLIATKASREQQDNITNVLILRGLRFTTRTWEEVLTVPWEFRVCC